MTAETLDDLERFVRAAGASFFAADSLACQAFAPKMTSLSLQGRLLEADEGLRSEDQDLPEVVAQHLPRALENLPDGPLSDALRLIAPHLGWTRGKVAIAANFKQSFAFTSMIGPDAPLREEGYRFGLYLQAPNSYYPAHSHRAVEFYYLLSGQATWALDDGAPFPVTAGGLVQHGSFQRHAMRAAGEPFLAMWIWTGDLDPGSYLCDPD